MPQQRYGTPLVHIDTTYSDILLINNWHTDTLEVIFENTTSFGSLLAFTSKSNDALFYRSAYPNLDSTNKCNGI